MPAKNPRLTITIKPELSAQLRTLSALTGNSQSSLIAELLEGSGPVFKRLIQVLTAAEEAKVAIKGKLTADMEQAQEKVQEQLGLVMETFDGYTGGLLDEVEAIKRRARRGGAKPLTAGARRGLTPPSNRGVRSPPQTEKTRSK
jgi:hypothetical protein